MSDWILNLAESPGAQARLALDGKFLFDQWIAESLLSLKPVVSNASTRVSAHEGEYPSLALSAAIANDTRFSSPTWHQFPWSMLAAGNKALEIWWQEATALDGMEPHSKEQMRFYAKQTVDMMSPCNWLLSNPEALQRAAETSGTSLLAGLINARNEWSRKHGLLPPNEAENDLGPGKALATTLGQVVMRNELIELVQYQPSTAQVRLNPVLIIPSCIMKFYILDLSPANSMVRWLVAQGHTVYMVSWRNPSHDDALLDMDDYVRLGVLSPMTHVHAATQEPVHLAGYCLGGTFASIAAAALAAQTQSFDAGGPQMASLTLMAAETDFSEPGEMSVLIDQAQVEQLEALTAAQGFLSGQQMAASFQFLHSRELIWSQRTHLMLMGEPAFSNDLMTWNADVTRLPAVMHSEYLRHMYLNNDLAEGRYTFEGQLISLHAIRVPVFVIGTEKDHVSPWRSVFKIHQLVPTPITFVLTSGGHNAGIVSEPGHTGRHYQMHCTDTSIDQPSPDQWMNSAAKHAGSWWPAWSDWLVASGSQTLIEARVPFKDPELGPAPGRFVMVRYQD